MVLEIPPAGDGSITGTIMDAWQAALEDVGPAGVDKGKGGKYLILPPGFKGKAPSGYIVLPSMTYQGYALLRSNLASGSDADVAKAAAYAKRIKLYPLSQARNPPPTVFVDAIDVVYDSTIPYDVRFFQSLDRIVQTEPWLPRDRVMIDIEAMKNLCVQMCAGLLLTATTTALELLVVRAASANDVIPAVNDASARGAAAPVLVLRGHPRLSLGRGQATWPQYRRHVS